MKKNNYTVVFKFGKNKNVNVTAFNPLEAYIIAANLKISQGLTIEIDNVIDNDSKNNYLINIDVNLTDL